MTGPVSGIGPLSGNAPEAARPSKAGGNFAAVLADRMRVSGHAAQRLAGVQLPAELAQRVGDAVDRAAAKGARDSLIVCRDLALVVSVPNRTVITAVTGARMHEGVFTHIDSAVIL